MKDRDTQYRELLEELTRLEEEAPVLDLRDPAGWDGYQQRLSELRDRIVAFKKNVSDPVIAPARDNGGVLPFAATHEPTRAFPSRTVSKRQGNR